MKTCKIPGCKRPIKLLKARLCGTHYQCIRRHGTVDYIYESTKVKLKRENKSECSKCKEVKDLNKFSKDKNTIIGIAMYCKECRSKQDKKYNKKNRAKNRDRYLRNTYDISLDQYSKILAKQNNACKICKKPRLEGKNLLVDHSHKTGRVRGLLCNFCNYGIGYFYDNPVFLANAADYLKEKE